MYSKVPINNIQTELSDRSERAFSSIALLKIEFIQKMSFTCISATKQRLFLKKSGWITAQKFKYGECVKSSFILIKQRGGRPRVPCMEAVHSFIQAFSVCLWLVSSNLTLLFFHFIIARHTIVFLCETVMDAHWCTV